MTSPNNNVKSIKSPGNLNTTLIGFDSSQGRTHNSGFHRGANTTNIGSIVKRTTFKAPSDGNGGVIRNTILKPLNND